MRVALLLLALLPACKRGTDTPGAVTLTVPEGVLSGTVDVSVEGDADQLSILVDDVSIGGGAGPTLTVAWDTTTVADGAHTVTGVGTWGDAEARDEAQVEVLQGGGADAAPSITFLSPADGAAVTGPDVEVSLSVTDDLGIASVVVSEGATVVQELPAEGPYTFTWSDVADGAHALTAVATDSGGHTSQASVSFTVAAETTMTCTITRPDDGDTVSGVTPVTANAAAEGGVETVQLLVEGDVVDSDDASPWDLEFDATPWSGSTVTVAILATAASGETCEDAITVQIATEGGFAVNITQPSDGGTVSGGAVPVRAAIGGGGGAESAELYVDGALTATDDASDWIFSWDSTTVANGAHELRVVGYERGTGATAEDTISVNVAN